MKTILALTSLLAAAAVNLAATHETRADTLVITTMNAADFAEIEVMRQPGLTAAQCAVKAAHVWQAAHKADDAALDAYCVTN